MVDPGLGNLALRLKVSRPALSAALKDMTAGGLVCGIASTTRRAKVINVNPPKRRARLDWDLGQLGLVSDLLLGSLGVELSYQQRMVMALLVAKSDWTGEIRGAGKQKLARCLGIGERQLRTHLRALQDQSYLNGYRGGMAAGGGKSPGRIFINPSKLYGRGWWQGVDLIEACHPLSGAGWLNQHRISNYLTGVMSPEVSERRSGAVRLGNKIAQPRAKAARPSLALELLDEYLLDLDLVFPQGRLTQFYGTARPGGRLDIRNSKWPDSWVKFAPASSGRLQRIDETFFELSCQMVEKYQGLLVTGGLSRLSINMVRPINDELIPLLTVPEEGQMGWSQRKWILQRLRLALARQALWTWCCIYTALGLDEASLGVPMKVHRVFPRRLKRKGGVPQAMWLVRDQSQPTRGGLFRRIDCLVDFTA